MTSSFIDFSPVLQICSHVKNLGYAAASSIRLYGEEFEVVSDPFPEANGVAVLVTTKKDSSIRALRIPLTMLQSAKRQANSGALSWAESAKDDSRKRTRMDESR